MNVSLGVLCVVDALGGIVIMWTHISALHRPADSDILSSMQCSTLLRVVAIV